VEIWYNPRCSKCRIAKEALDEAGRSYELRRYLDEPPGEDELRDVLAKLDLEPWEICRTGDAHEAGVDLPPNDAGQRDAWIALLAANPALIQRPIVVTDDGSAYIARDADTVAAVVDSSG
jgi:arsenate reductase